MSQGKDVICTGCGRTAFETGMYKHDPVEEDGTYAEKKFVCDFCYVELIGMGLDIGNAYTLQARAERLIKYKDRRKKERGGVVL